MTYKERLSVYDEATKLWGVVAQYDQCIEEMAELIVALNKYKRKVYYNEYAGDFEIENNVIEELADVTICLEQMTSFFNKQKVDEAIEVKMQKFQKQIIKQRALKDCKK